jgi:hypothetical protein
MQLAFELRLVVAVFVAIVAVAGAFALRGPIRFLVLLAGLLLAAYLAGLLESVHL